VNLLLKELTDEISNAESEGQLLDISNRFEKLYFYAKKYQVFSFEVSLNQNLNLEKSMIYYHLYLLKGFILYGDFSKAKSQSFSLSKRLNKSNTVSEQLNTWKDLIEAFPKEKKNSFDEKILYDFIYLNVTLHTSIKYELGISGKKAFNAFLNLSIFIDEDIEIGKLLTKICLRVKNEKIVKLFYNLFPYLRKEKFKDKLYKELSGKTHEIKEREDITVLKEFHEI